MEHTKKMEMNPTNIGGKNAIHFATALTILSFIARDVPFSGFDYSVCLSDVSRDLAAGIVKDAPKHSHVSSSFFDGSLFSHSLGEGVAAVHTTVASTLHRGKHNRRLNGIHI